MLLQENVYSDLAKWPYKEDYTIDNTSDSTPPGNQILRPTQPHSPEALLPLPLGRFHMYPQADLLLLRAIPTLLVPPSVGQGDLPKLVWGLALVC